MAPDRADPEVTCGRAWFLDAAHVLGDLRAAVQYRAQCDDCEAHFDIRIEGNETTGGKLFCRHCAPYHCERCGEIENDCECNRFRFAPEQRESGD